MEALVTLRSVSDDSVVPTKKRIRFIIKCIVDVNPTYSNLGDLDEVLQSIRELGKAEVVNIQLIDAEE